jgi:hypothetical protein
VFVQFGALRNPAERIPDGVPPALWGVAPAADRSTVSAYLSAIVAVSAISRYGCRPLAADAEVSDA